MKTFLLFVSTRHENCIGVEDYVDSYDTVLEALDAIKDQPRYKYDVDWQVVRHCNMKKICGGQKGKTLADQIIIQTIEPTPVELMFDVVCQPWVDNHGNTNGVSMHLSEADRNYYLGVRCETIAKPATDKPSGEWILVSVTYEFYENLLVSQLFKQEHGVRLFDYNTTVDASS